MLYSLQEYKEVNTYAKKLVTCALALISVIFIAGCANSSYDPSDGGVLNEDVALELKQDFFASDYNNDYFSSPESVVIYENFGDYNRSEKYPPS